MPMYMHTNCLLFASCNKLLNNPTFYHLKSLIALPIMIIRIFWGGDGLAHTPIATSSFAPGCISSYRHFDNLILTPPSTLTPPKRKHLTHLTHHPEAGWNKKLPNVAPPTSLFTFLANPNTRPPVIGRHMYNLFQKSWDRCHKTFEFQQTTIPPVQCCVPFLVGFDVFWFKQH